MSRANHELDKLEDRGKTIPYHLHPELVPDEDGEW